MANITSVVLKTVLACAVGTTATTAAVYAVRAAQAKPAPVAAAGTAIPSTNASQMSSILPPETREQISTAFRKAFTASSASGKQVLTNSLYNASQAINTLKSNPTDAAQQKANQTLATLTATLKAASAQNRLPAKYISKLSAMKAGLQSALQNPADKRAVASMGPSSSNLTINTANHKDSGHLSRVIRPDGSIAWGSAQAKAHYTCPVAIAPNVSTPTCQGNGYSDPARNSALGTDVFVTGSSNIASLAAQLGSTSNAFAC